MDNLVKESNSRLQAIIDDLLTIKEEYERKIVANGKSINKQLSLVKKYKEEFYTSKQKVEKMNADIAGFEKDYESLVNRFKDDELASILVNVNKEISAKIEERKRNIISDKKAMNSLVTKAEIVKEKLVKLTAEKNALELCYRKICDAYDFYDTCLSQIIEFSNENSDNLCSYFEEGFNEENTSVIDDIVEEIEVPIDETEEVQEEIEENNEEDVVNNEVAIEDENESIEETEDIKVEEEQEDSIEFSEDDFIPEDELENVIDLNKLNEEAMAKENEEPIEDEEDIEDIVVEEENEIELEEEPIIDFTNDNGDFENMFVNDDLEDDDSIYEN